MDVRLGVIDIGSNTVHLLIVDAHHGARPLPAFSHQLPLRLSEHLDDEGRVRPEGAGQLVDFAVAARAMADEHGVEELLLFATSALRAAANGEEVLAAVGASTRIPVTVLSGKDEARLTYLAARRWCGWSAGTLLVLDIGGGSFELASGMDEEPDAAVSVALGAGRVTRELLPGDPPTPAAIGEARKVIRARLAKSFRPLVRAADPDTIVATSKTFRSLARLAGAAPSSDGLLVERVLTREGLAEVVARIAPLTAAERTQLPGVSAARAAQVLAGGLVAEAALDLLHIDAVTICPWALREGVILRRLEALREDEPPVS